MKIKHHELFQFFGCYFHQDWMCESPDPDDIIRSFASDSTPETIFMVKNEISTLLKLKLSNENIRKLIMSEMPCNYCYWLDWESGEMWLKHILQVMTHTDASQLGND
ncbi:MULTISPECIES: contact-dependent growth inhibition system immunity protein [Pseudomonas]|uniref:contact-dependent growth inhibition system immunity protein n=1 Tax=Pseudomonas TaxID=286 RepID=UPI00389AFD05